MSGTPPNFEGGFPVFQQPLVDVRTGRVTGAWRDFLQSLWDRTGGPQGGNIKEITRLVETTGLDWSDEPVLRDQELQGELFSDLHPLDAAQDQIFQAETLSVLPEPLPQDQVDWSEEGRTSWDDETLRATLLTNEADERPILSPFHPGYAAGQFYPAWDGNVGATGAIGAVDTIYLYPFFIHHDVQISTLFLRVVTAGAGSSAKAGIWMSVNGRPAGTPVVVDNTGQATSATGMVNFSISATVLRRGWYWVGTKFTGTLPVCTNIVGTSALMASRIGGSANTNAILNGATNQMAGLSTPDAFANAMPDLTSASFTNVVIASSGIPVLGFGVA